MEEGKAWVPEVDLVGLRGRRGGAQCGQSGMVVGKEQVGEGEEEVVLGESDGGKVFADYLLLLVGVGVVGEEDNISVGEVVVVVVAGNRLVDKGSLMGIHIHIS